MAAQSFTLLINTPYVTAGVDASNGVTYTYTIPSTGAGAGVYFVSCQTTYQPGTALSIAVKQNGTTEFTMPTPGQTQSASQFYTNLLCAVGDVITVNLTSSNATDELLNTIQSTAQIMNGPR
jgi:hypothetical protein